MNEKRTNPTPELGESELRRLLEAAGPRPEVPAAELAAIQAAARDDWRRMVAARRAEPSSADLLPGRWRRWGGWRTAAPLALAATLLVALSVGLWWRGLRPPVSGGAVVAAVEGSAGAVRADGSLIAVGHQLMEGTEIATPGGTDDPAWLALRLTGGQSVRLAAESRLRLTGDSALELLRGAVYVDSAVEGRSLEVQTALGSVRDIGTQFEVRLDPGAERLRVRVREGSVEVEHGAESHSAVAGEELTVGADGSLERGTVALWGAEWDWVLAAAPGLAVETLTLGDYLDWLSRETGWEVRFTDNELASSAPDIEIFGAGLEGLSPIDSLDAAFPSSALRYRVADGVLHVER